MESTPSAPAGMQSAGPQSVKNTTDEYGPTAKWLMPLLIGTPVVGGISLIVFSLVRTSSGWTAFGVGCGAVAGASAIGSLLGFLFGIPRSLQSSAPVTTGDVPSGYQPNTNLEQISDWLTKILVGVGLVEFKAAGDPLRRLVHSVGQGMGDTPAARTIAAALLTVFVIWGFLVSYLITRTQAAGAFRQSDVLAITQRAVNQAKQEITQTLDEKAVRDATLLSLVEQALNPSTGAPPIDQSELDAAMAAASPAARVQAFTAARRQRRTTWRDNKARMALTIPVFRALVSSDVGNEYHRNHGELGFALKDQPVPDWKAALTALDEAIRRRPPGEHTGLFYEFNRVLCLLTLAEAGTAEPNTDERVTADLRAVAANAPLFELLKKQTVVARWIQQTGWDIG
jgi:hypothetical protein